VTLKRYAKWKAITISTALQNGETPIPGSAGFTSESDVNQWIWMMIRLNRNLHQLLRHPYLFQIRPLPHTVLR